MNKRNFVMLAGTLAVVTVLSLAASAQTNVQIAVPSDIPVIVATGTDKGDALVITGMPSGTTPAVGCVTTAGNYPIQSGVIVDPHGSRATRVSTFILISQTTALDPGTKLINIGSTGSCITGGVTYNTFSATIQ